MHYQSMTFRNFGAKVPRAIGSPELLPLAENAKAKFVQKTAPTTISARHLNHLIHDLPLSQSELVAIYKPTELAGILLPPT